MEAAVRGDVAAAEALRAARRRNEQSALRQRTRLRRESRLAAAQHQLEAAKALAQFEAAEAEAERWAAANAKRDQPQQPEEHGVGAQPQPHGQGQTQSFGTHSHAPSGAQQLLLAAQKMHEATASALKHDAQGQGQDRGHGKVPGRNIARPTTPPYFPLRSNLPPPEPDPERETLQRARDRELALLRDDLPLVRQQVLCLDLGRGLVNRSWRRHIRQLTVALRRLMSTISWWTCASCDA